MTTHTWTTTADVPPAAWAAMCADMQALLAVSAAAGAEVTNPTGDGPPQLDADGIGFRVTNPGAQSLTVGFARQAGDGGCNTSSVVTDGLVVAALERARRHFGPLLTTTTDAGTAAQAVARRISAELFDAGDRALTGQPELVAPARQLGTGAAVRALTRAAEVYGITELTPYLDAVIAELTAERDGWAAAGALLGVA